MIIPKLQGHFDQDGFFIYIACDIHYFNNFGKSIINSIKQNTNVGTHIHLYNPTQDQINFCQTTDKVSITYEYAPLELFKVAESKWHQPLDNPVDQLNYKRIITAMSKSNDQHILDRMQRTYYACARFIRLNEIISSNTSCIAIDVDAIVRNNLPVLPNTYDFYIHQITGPKSRFLAGGLLLTGNQQGYNFLNEYASVLKHNISLDQIHWGMDQDVLDFIVPKYNFGPLPISYIDWNMDPSSFIWTAKGKRKDHQAFINEQMKYNS